jgi:hypothetical protein
MGNKELENKCKKLKEEQAKIHGCYLKAMEKLLHSKLIIILTL